MVRTSLKVAIAAAFAFLLVSGAPAGAQESTTTPYGPNGPTVNVDDTQVQAGDVLNLSGECVPNEQVTVSLQGEVLATTTSGADGAYSVAVPLPSDLRPGTYTLAVECGGQVTYVTIQVLGAGGGTGGTGPLSRTGTDLTTPVAVGVGLLAVGGVALALTSSRRRRTA